MGIFNNCLDDGVLCGVLQNLLTLVVYITTSEDHVEIIWARLEAHAAWNNSVNQQLSQFFCQLAAGFTFVAFLSSILGKPHQ